jgi:hypothetical protein
MSNEIILIVNDDDDISFIVQMRYRGIEGFKTIKYNNASLALEEIKLRPEEFAAFLVDKSYAVHGYGSDINHKK